MQFRNMVATGLLTALSVFAAGEYSGRRAPSFALPDSNLVHYDILDYRGKVVVLDFMSATCAHCLEVAPVFEEIKKKYGVKVAVLSIVTYPPDNNQTVAGFIKESGTTVPILFDCGQVTRNYLKITPQSSRRDLPHVFVIDRGGTIRNDFAYGAATKKFFTVEGLSAEIDKLLK